MFVTAYTEDGRAHRVRSAVLEHPVLGAHLSADPPVSLGSDDEVPGPLSPVQAALVSPVLDPSAVLESADEADVPVAKSKPKSSGRRSRPATPKAPVDGEKTENEHAPAR